MAFSKSYLGDTVATGVLLPTIFGKAGVIPGVTVKPELGIVVNANVAEFWYNLAPTVDIALAGADFNSTNVGSKKATLTLARALRIDEKIPQVAIDTVSVDLVAATLGNAALALGNRLGLEFYKDLLFLAQKKTYTNALNMINAIAEGIATFKTGASVKIFGASDTTFSNSTNGVEPTTIIVGSIGERKLRQADSFQSLFQGQATYPGQIGTLFGLPVIVSSHLDGIDVDGVTAGVQPADFVLLNYQGVAYPAALSMLRTVEAEGFNGIRLQGEVVFPQLTSGATGDALPGVLVIDSYAMTFREAAAS
jgi:hypothetical protein